MGSLNQVTLIGNLGRDAELRYTQGGTAVATISVATTETWNDKQGQKQERTEWTRCVVWGKTAEAISQYLTKGKSVCVVGKLQTNKWTDKEGVERYSTEVKADRVVLLGGGQGGSRRQEHDDDYQPAADEPSGPTGGIADDDIPF